MSLSNYARKKAFQYMINIYRQAAPNANTNTGSVIRDLIITPISLFFTAVFVEIERAKGLFLGNYANLSEEDMDNLAQNILKKRPPGSRSTSIVRVYLNEPQPFELRPFPYFRSVNGIEFSPVSRLSFTLGDFFQDDNNEWYVNVPVISTTFGNRSTVTANSITEYSSFPIRIKRCTNPVGSQGGSPTFTNEQYFEYIQKTISDGTVAQVGGIVQFILDNFNAEDIEVVSSNDARMLRDEVWSNGNTFNIDHLGYPASSYVELVNLDFDKMYGRVYSPTGQFVSSMEGKRVFVDGDYARFRTIRRVINANYAVFSGYTMDGQSNAKVYDKPPKILNKSDVYVYFPNIEIRSTTVDGRVFLSASRDVPVGSTRIYYQLAPGESRSFLLSGNGMLNIGEGTDENQSYRIVAMGDDLNFGPYFDVSQPVEIAISTNIGISYYNSDEINFGTDIPNVPSIYVLQVDKIDPINFDVVEQIPRTSPGSYSSPGWYIKNTNPINVFSAKEQKAIVIDSKVGTPGFSEVENNNAITVEVATFKTGTNTTSGSSRINAINDWNFSDGREVIITIPELTLADTEFSSVTPDVLAGAGTDEVTLDYDFEYFTDVGYRDDATITFFDGITPLQVFNPGEYYLYGNKFKPRVGIVNASADRMSYIKPVNIETPGATSGPSYRPETIIESVIIDRDTDNGPIHILSDLLYTKANAAGIDATINSVKVYAPPIEREYANAPIRVIYATASEIQEAQDAIDGSDTSLLCRDTLIRSFMPSTIDATIKYRGESTAEEIYQRFVSLIQEVTTATDDGTRLRLDISNIIAELDEEGFTDSIEVNFEVRVTNFLTDGEFEVRYLNPSKTTKQEVVVASPISIGDNRATMRFVDPVDQRGQLSGRGRLFLGGRNPSTQELIPYEAIIDLGNDEFEVIFRTGKTAEFAHPEWETAIVSVRDYDPELEFKEGAIFIPPDNRPYVKELIFKKLNND